MINPFFKNFGPFNIEKLLDKSGIENKEKMIFSTAYHLHNFKISPEITC